MFGIFTVLISVIISNKLYHDYNLTLNLRQWYQILYYSNDYSFNYLKKLKYSFIDDKYLQTKLRYTHNAMVASHRQSISGKWYVKLECASSVPSPGVGGVPGRFP